MRKMKTTDKFENGPGSDIGSTQVGNKVLGEQMVLGGGSIEPRLVAGMDKTIKS